MKTRLLLLAMTFLSASFTPTWADDTPQSFDINPACADAPFRDFDFWIGTWEVRSPTGQLAGVNEITAEEGGCLLIERWTGASGGTGQSYNYIDRDTGTWRQVWVSAAFTIDYSGGLGADGTMVLEGRIAYAGNPDNNGPFRGRWTLREDETVEQVFHQYSDTQSKWVPWFTGIYSKRTLLETD